MYAPSVRGKNNLYKIFVCRALDLAEDGGHFGFIVPMALLGDDQAADLRRAILNHGAFTSVDAFPPKDDPRKRVFPEAKLSTVVFTALRTVAPTLQSEPFVSRVHPERTFEPRSPSFQLTAGEIPLYDPSNLTVLSCSQDDWDLATRMMRSPGMAHLGDFATSFQGEINETTCRRWIDYEGKGSLILRGANVCLYALREASQGEAAYLDVNRFLTKKRQGTKAFDHLFHRIGFQRMSPQNNFRRLIMAPIPKGQFCFDSISYFTPSSTVIPFEVIIAVFNSRLTDWYFRLGSTNATINEYQVDNLPCPLFSEITSDADRRIGQTAQAELLAGDTSKAFESLREGFCMPPFGTTVRDTLVCLVLRIMKIEKARGEIARAERSALAPEAQPYQDLIDRLFYAMAGLTEDELEGLEGRLARML